MPSEIREVPTGLSGICGLRCAQDRPLAPSGETRRVAWRRPAI